MNYSGKSIPVSEIFNKICNLEMSKNQFTMFNSLVHTNTLFIQSDKYYYFHLKKKNGD